MNPLIWNKTKTAEELGGISLRHLHNLVRRGDIPATRVGRRVMFRPEDVRAYIDRQHPVGATTNSMTASRP